MIVSHAKRLTLLAALVTALAACSFDNTISDLARSETNGLEKSDQRESAASLLARAQALRARGSPIEALAALADAHRRFPSNAAVTSAYGRMALLLGHDEVAAPLLAEAIEVNPGDWRALSAQGVLESRKGRLPDGRKALVKASMISASEAVILNNLAVNDLLEGKPAAAVSLLRQGLASPELKPQNRRRLKRNLALALALEGNFAEADQLAGEKMPRDLGSADNQRLSRLLGVSEMKLAAESGWTAQIATSAPRQEPAVQ